MFILPQKNRAKMWFSPSAGAVKPGSQRKAQKQRNRTTLEACAVAKSRVGTRQPTGKTTSPEAARPARTIFCPPPKPARQVPARTKLARMTDPEDHARRLAQESLAADDPTA